jgi:hypothetical protein
MLESLIHVFIYKISTVNIRRLVNEQTGSCFQHLSKITKRVKAWLLAAHFAQRRAEESKK